jgi:hypothetical protein
MYFYLDSSVRVPKDLRVKDIKYDAGLKNIFRKIWDTAQQTVRGFFGFLFLLRRFSFTDST